MIFVECRVKVPFALDRLEQAAQTALEHEGSGAADLTLVLAGDDQLRGLNRQYLGRDAVTDVLSFPADEADPESGCRYLGDILLSMPRAAAQAQAGGHPVEQEAQLLVVHGTLHLLGYDHGRKEEKERMWAVQAEILEQLGVPAGVVHG